MLKKLHFIGAFQILWIVSIAQKPCNFSLHTDTAFNSISLLLPEGLKEIPDEELKMGGKKTTKTPSFPFKIVIMGLYK